MNVGTCFVKSFQWSVEEQRYMNAVHLLSVEKYSQPQISGVLVDARVTVARVNIHMPQTIHSDNGLCETYVM